MRWITVFACILFLTCQPGNRQMTDAERAEIEKIIIAKHREMSELSSQLDAEKVWDFFIENNHGIYAIEGALTLTYDEAVNSGRESYNSLEWMKTDMQQEYAAVLSPESALFTGTGTVSGKIKSGDSFSVPFAITVVYVLRNGEWKAVHMHESTPNMPDI